MSKLKCPECPYETQNEGAFIRHLIRRHAFRLHQASREVEKQDTTPPAKGIKQEVQA